MPSIIQNRKRDAYKDLQEEIKVQQVRHDCQAISKLAKKTSIPQTTLWSWLSDPEAMRLSGLNAIVQALHPDPAVVLAALGYTTKDIKKFKEI